MFFLFSLAGFEVMGQVAADVPTHSHEAFEDQDFLGKERKSGVFMPRFVPDSQDDAFSFGVSFTGSNRSQSGFIPPDTMGAVGPNHIVELINGRYVVYNKTGVLLTQASLNAFWTAAGITPAGSFAFDPRIVFDSFSGRWFAVAVDNAGAANNILVAVSAGIDPTTGWTGFQIDSDTDNVEWADFPTLGVNNDVLAVGVNMFPIAAGNSNISVLVIPKSDLLLGSPTVANRTLFENINPNNTGFTVQPVFDQDNGMLPLSLLSSYNKPVGTLKTSTITGTAAAPTLTTAGGFIAVASRASPPTIDQPGPKPNIEAGDSRFSGNVFRQMIPGRTNTSLWAVHSVEISGLAAIEWYEIDEVTNGILQSGTISDPTLGFNFPSIAVNNSGDVVIGFSGGDPATFISTYVVVGATVAGVTTFGPVTQTMAGVADYIGLDSISRNRWGDYSATVVDPTNDLHFWTFQEFVSATDVYAVRVNQIIILPPTAADVTVSGRVLSPAGRGIPNAVVHATDQDGNIKTARTNMFGYYRVEGIGSGQTLIFNVFSKSYQFTTQVVNVQDSIRGLDFTAQGGEETNNEKLE